MSLARCSQNLGHTKFVTNIPLWVSLTWGSWSRNALVAPNGGCVVCSSIGGRPELRDFKGRGEAKKTTLFIDEAAVLRVWSNFTNFTSLKFLLFFFSGTISHHLYQERPVPRPPSTSSSQVLRYVDTRLAPTLVDEMLSSVVVARPPPFAKFPRKLAAPVTGPCLPLS